jgi:alginate O-acetyltransferase complex protein AlgI
MLFNSYSFIFIFLPITFIGTLFIGKYSHKYAIMWLGAASLVFYGFWDALFISLLLASVIANYIFGRWLDALRKAQHKHLNTVLTIAILTNLLILGYFKYTNFFIGSIIELFGGEFLPFNIILPLGISFFTFTQIGFLVDVSRGLTHESSLTRYLLFVTYFPHLIAGPLLHHKQVMPQFSNPTAFKLNIQNISVGVTIFVLALAKKIFLADSLGEIADPIFNSAHKGHQPMFVEAWIGSLAYPLQLYFDFSAYSEMAIGLSLMFNIRLPLNFNSPFKATNLIEYWQRWHMSLTKYIYEYLYTPITIRFMRFGLGKSKLAENIYTVMLPTFITFLIIGLWHGANWTFVAFGALHGIYLIINYSWQGIKKSQGWKPNGALYNMCACGLTYLAVLIAGIFFRCETIAASVTMVKGIVGLNGISLPLTAQSYLSYLPIDLAALGVTFQGMVPNQTLTMSPLLALLFIAVGQAIVWLLPNMHQIMSRYDIVVEDLAPKSKKMLAALAQTPKWWVWHPTMTGAVLIGLLFFSLIITMATNKPSTFLYYQF